MRRAAEAPSAAAASFCLSESRRELLALPASHAAAPRRPHEPRREVAAERPGIAEGIAELRSESGSEAANDLLAASEGDASEAFFQVPVGAGGDFLQSSSVATSGSGALASVAGSGPAAVATVGQRKKDKKKKGGDADESPSNGWSPATDEVAESCPV